MSMTAWPLSTCKVCEVVAPSKRPVYMLAQHVYMSVAKPFSLLMLAYN